MSIIELYAEEVLEGTGTGRMNFTLQMSRLIRSIVSFSPMFRHIDPQKVLPVIGKARSKRREGMVAKIVPLRFPRGTLTYSLRGRVYHHPRVFCDGEEKLFIIYYYQPRYQNLPLQEKVLTIFHELYHIHPRTRGELRLFQGRRSLHGMTCKRFDEALMPSVQRFIEKYDGRRMLDFLRNDYTGMRRRYGSLSAVKIKLPSPGPHPMRVYIWT